MSYQSTAIANYFLDLAKASGKKLDPMQIQKLVYFAHGWNLAFTATPLINDRIEAWDFGPVVHNLHHVLKVWGSGKIEGPLSKWKITGVEPKTRKTIIGRVSPSLNDPIPGADRAALVFAKNLLKRIVANYLFRKPAAD